MSPFLIKLADLLDALGTQPAASTASIKTSSVSSKTEEQLRATLAGLSSEALTKIAEDPELSVKLEPWLPQAASRPMGEAVKHAFTKNPTTDAERLEAASRHFEDYVLAATNN